MVTTIKGNKIINSGVDGIHVEGPVKGDLNMSDNEISNSGRHAIYFDTQEKVDALKLLSKALQAANKQKLMKDVEQAIKLETENPQANKNKILSILAKVSSETLNKGSELAAIGNFAIALIQFFHGQPIDPTLLITLKQIFKVS